MAKAKKVHKYVPNTQLPPQGSEYKILDKKYSSLLELLAFEEKTRLTVDETWDRFANLRRALIGGEITDTEWKAKTGEWWQRSLYNAAWPSTPEFDAINDSFMAEYDSREDLQEVYKVGYDSRYWIHGRYGQQVRKDDPKSAPYATRPDSYRMFAEAYSTQEARKMVELARETPYIEGDLVMLRAPFVGHRDHDPYYVAHYSPAGQAGQTTPDATHPRIATVIAVTDEIETWRASKGSKVLKVIWMGKEDVENVQEKYIKWHMRPTYKNGLKVRPDSQ